MRELPIEMKIALRDYGLQEARLARLSPRSRVMRDLRICGDDLGRFYDCLAKAYDSDLPPPDEYVALGQGRDCLFVMLGAFLPLFDRFIEAPEVTLFALDRHFRE